MIKNEKSLRVPLEVALMLKIPDHTNVIQLYDFAQLGEYFVLVIERPEPVKDLADILNMRGSESFEHLRPAVAKFLFRQILMGLMHCHASGVFHGDITPANIVVDLNTSRASIIDFGCAVEHTSDKYCCSRDGKFDVTRTTTPSLLKVQGILHTFLSLWSDLLPVSLTS